MTSPADSPKIDYTAHPADFFFVPGVDSGLALLRPVSKLWRPVPRGRISAFAISAYDTHNTRLAPVINDAVRTRAFSHAVEVASAPVLLSDVSIQKNMIAVGGKWLLSGAAGTRVRNRHWKHQDLPPEQIDTAIDAAFRALQSSDGPMQPIEILSKPADRNLPYVIEARNLFNYYHFLIETLPRLEHCVEIGHKGPIHIVFHSDKISGFVLSFIRTLYPELADRVSLVPSPAQYDLVYSDFCFDHYYFMSPERLMPSVRDLMQEKIRGEDRQTFRHSKRMFDANGYHACLAKLRKRALRAIKGQDFGHLPKRFWVSRDPASPRARPMKNEDLLLEQLIPMGFEVIRFETYSPLEQIALMANAEVMASHHGAGFANMLFAGPNTHVVEIGHAQTAVARWRDFFPLAHVSGCHYVSFFADHNWETPELEPEYEQDGLVAVAISRNGIRSVARFLSALLGQTPRNSPLGEVQRAADMLAQSGSWKQLGRFLERFDPLVATSADLMLLYARVKEAEQNPEATFHALSLTLQLDQTRFGVLEWMVWLTRRIDRPDLADTLMETHAELFPERHQAFRQRLKWYQPGAASLRGQ